jgi:large subunit ribosomal protein L13
MKTHVVKGGDITRRWYLVDASGQTLGRLASRIATILRGKDRPDFTPWLDMGGHVVVVNAEKIRLSGRKRDQIVYDRYSGYRSGLKKIPLRRVMERDPGRVLRRAVWGMLPHNSLGRRMIKKLRVYAGAEHPHAAQQPEKIDLETRI